MFQIDNLGLLRYIFSLKKCAITKWKKLLLASRHKYQRFCRGVSQGAGGVSQGAGGVSQGAGGSRPIVARFALN